VPDSRRGLSVLSALPSDWADALSKFWGYAILQALATIFLYSIWLLIGPLMNPEIRKVFMHSVFFSFFGLFFACVIPESVPLLWPFDDFLDDQEPFCLFLRNKGFVSRTPTSLPKRFPLFFRFTVRFPFRTLSQESWQSDVRTRSHNLAVALVTFFPGAPSLTSTDVLLFFYRCQVCGQLHPNSFQALKMLRELALHLSQRDGLIPCIYVVFRPSWVQVDGDFLFFLETTSKPPFEQRLTFPSVRW